MNRKTLTSLAVGVVTLMGMRLLSPFRSTSAEAPVGRQIK